MKLFAINAPRASEANAGPEGARAARTGFSWGALIFGPLWLLARGLWSELVGYVAAAAVVVALAEFASLRPGAVAALFVLGHLYLGFEGRALGLAARIRSGRALIDVLFARSLLEAEKVHLERALPGEPAALRGGGRYPEVVGLFEDPPR